MIRGNHFSRAPESRRRGGPAIFRASSPYLPLPSVRNNRARSQRAPQSSTRGRARGRHPLVLCLRTAGKTWRNLNRPIAFPVHGGIIPNDDVGAGNGS